MHSSATSPMRCTDWPAAFRWWRRSYHCGKHRSSIRRPCFGKATEPTAMPVLEYLFLVTASLAVGVRLADPRTVDRINRVLLAIAFCVGIVELLAVGPR